MKIDILANKIGLTPDETEDLLLDLIGKNEIKGRLVLETNEFISGMVDVSLKISGNSEISSTTCPNCGGILETTPAGDTVSKCSHCGVLLTHQ
ncbi:MAG: hypothetical protein ACTSUE_03690 [Promethearchaeota archaeon]